MNTHKSFVLSIWH